MLTDDLSLKADDNDDDDDLERLRRELGGLIISKYIYYAYLLITFSFKMPLHGQIC
jgi:hypothetical protein